MQTGELQFVTSDPNISVVNLHPSKRVIKIITQAEQQRLEAPPSCSGFKAAHFLLSFQRAALSLTAQSPPHFSACLDSSVKS